MRASFPLLAMVVALQGAPTVIAQSDARGFGLPVPAANGAWTITIRTGGGFSGQGSGSATLTSEGTLSCLKTAAPCLAKLEGQKLDSVLRLVSTFNVSRWIVVPAPQDNVPQPTSLCRDCYTTTLTFSRREGDGVKSFALIWDDVSQAGVPAEVRQFVETVLAGKS